MRKYIVPKGMTRGFRTEKTTMTWKTSKWLGSQSTYISASRYHASEVWGRTVVVERPRPYPERALAGYRGFSGGKVCDQRKAD
jgi:hypothetical protein